VARLVAAAGHHPRAGLVCAEFGAGFDMVPAIDKVIGGFYRPAARGEGWEDVEYPHGTLLLVRRQTLEDVGMFDERYFAYCEEVDLALRVRQAGWEIGMVWGAVVTNSHLPSRPLADYLQVRNTLLLIHDFYGGYFVGWRCALAAWQIASKSLREPRRASTHLRLEGGAIVDFLRRRFGPPPPAIVEIDRGATHLRPAAGA
jgi:GT2 family glycosyltransferase